MEVIIVKIAGIDIYDRLQVNYDGVCVDVNSQPWEASTHVIRDVANFTDKETE